MLRKILIITVLLASYLFAIGGIDSLSEDRKKIVTHLQTTLEIKEKDAFKIYSERFELYLNTKNWNYYFQSNNELKINKIGSSKNKVMFLTFLKGDRIVNMSFVKFEKEKQIAVYVLETLPRTEQVTLNQYDELNKNKNYTKSEETPNYAYFEESGYAGRVNIFVSAPVGAVQYSDYYLYDIE